MLITRETELNVAFPAAGPTVEMQIVHQDYLYSVYNIILVENRVLACRKIMGITPSSVIKYVRSGMY